MKLSRTVVKRIVWPQNGSLFAIIGGAAGLFADITAFFSALVSPYILLAVFSGLAVVSALLCFQRAMLADAGNAEAVDEVIRCRVCDSMRFSLFTAAAFMILILIGQGQTATETIVDRLGMIQKDVAKISDSVEVIGEGVAEIGQNVVEISEAVQSHKIIAAPKSAAEYYANAWIYTFAQRDTAKAMMALEAMYDAYEVNKLDAAELYYNTARQVKAREDLMAEMEKIGTERKDATLLLVAGRYATTREESERLYAKAREIDPDQPFAYWDMQNTHAPAGRAARIEAGSQAAAMRLQASAIEAFLDRISKHPAGYYFFLPQYQGDHETIARQTLSGLKTNLETLEGLDRQMQELKRK